MKRKNLIFAVFAAIVAAAASCAKEQVETSGIAGGIPAGTPMTITAGLDTKIYYQNGKNIRWTTSDKLRVFNDKSAGSTFTTQSGSEQEAEFTCDNWIGGTPVFAVHSYPESLFKDYVYGGENAVTAYLSPSQSIVHKQSFSKYSILSVGTISKPEDSYVISEMKNVFGSIGFILSSPGVKSVTLTGNNGEYLAGWVDVDYNNGEPTWAVSEAEGKETSKSIVATVSGGGAVDKDNLTFVPNTTYYINVLPQTFEKGLTIELENTDGSVLTRVISKQIDIKRNHRHSITTAIDNITIDCTTVGEETFKYVNGETISKLSKRVSGGTYDVIDFWSASYPDYKFNGAVRYWGTNGNGLNFKVGSFVRFPRISGYKLSKITDVKVVHTSGRNYKITAEPADNYDGGVTVAGGEAKNLGLNSDPASFILTDEYDANKDYYIVCNGEAGIRFKLTYQKVNIAQE